MIVPEVNSIIDDLTSLLPIFYKTLKEIRSEILGNKELANVHVQILFALKNEGLQNMSSLCKRTAASKPNLTVFVNKLIALNYVERTYDPSDRRIVFVRLTDEGKKFLDNHILEMKEYYRQLVAVYSPEDLVLLRSTLDNAKYLISKYQKKQEI